MIVKTIVLPVLSLPSPAARFCLPSKRDLRNICLIFCLSLALRSPLFFSPLSLMLIASASKAAQL